MPRSRAGRVVRCPECKCAMRVATLTESQLKMDGTIECRAKLARRRNLDPEEAAQRERESAKREAKQQRIEKQKLNAVADEDSQQVIPPPVPAEYLDLPDPGVSDPQRPTRSNPVGPNVVASPSDFPSASKNVTDESPTHFINLDDPAERFEDDEEEKDWEEKLSVANEDRRLFARFFAICLCLIAVLNIIPASFQWYHWAQLPDSVPLPRWIYIQMFIGLIYLVYAFFLAQVPDWSALRAVSVAMLLMAFVFGIISAGLLIGGHGDFSGYLGIPFALNRQACIWCVVMLCVATLMSFWGGKESANWRRTEQILQNIATKAV